MLKAEEIPIAADVIREFRVAVSNIFLYSSANSLVDQSVEKFLQYLRMLYGAREEVTIGIADGQVVVESTALDEKNTGSTAMIQSLFHNLELHSLTLKQGLQLAEFKALGKLLQPRALPAGTTLAQAIESAGLQHVLANTRVFISMQEGEQGEAAAEKIKENEEFKTAMEALQYFLGVFDKMESGTDKREIAKIFGEKIGSWMPNLAAQGTWDLLMGSPAEDGAVEVHSTWDQLQAVLESFNRLLVSAEYPEELKSEVTDMEKSTERLLNAAAQWRDKKKGPDEDQAALFDTDPILASLEVGNLKPIRDLRREDDVIRFIEDIPKEPRMGILESFWEGIWQAIQDPDGEVQALGLRHLSGWKWQDIPRHLQIDGMGRLKVFISACGKPKSYHIALLIAHGWLTEEWKDPEWPAFNALTRVLSDMEHIPVESFKEQKAKAKRVLDALWFLESFEELLRRSTGPESDSRGPRETWHILGKRASSFLLEKALQPDLDEAISNAVFRVLERLEFAGQEMLLNAWSVDAKPFKLEAFLRLFNRLIMTGGVANRLRDGWGDMDPIERQLMLVAAAKWGRWEFRDVALEQIENANNTEAHQILRLYPAIAREGDTRDLIRVVENRKYWDKAERDLFLVDLCVVLGRIAESLAVPILEDWVQSKGLLDKRNEKSDVVKQAALRALGQFRSQQVRAFLERFVEHGDKELRPMAAFALRSIVERMAEK